MDSFDRSEFLLLEEVFGFELSNNEIVDTDAGQIAVWCAPASHIRKFSQMYDFLL